MGTNAIVRPGICDHSALALSCGHYDHKHFTLGAVQYEYRYRKYRSDIKFRSLAKIGSGTSLQTVSYDNCADYEDSPTYYYGGSIVHIMTGLLQQTKSNLYVAKMQQNEQILMLNFIFS